MVGSPLDAFATSVAFVVTSRFVSCMSLNITSYVKYICYQCMATNYTK